MTPRDELLDLIEAYADAKVSGNRRLRQLITTELSLWLQKHDVVSSVAVPDEIKEQVVDLPQVKKPRRKAARKPE